MPPASRDVLLAAVVAVATALLTQPDHVPDATELAAAGACLWRVAFDAQACVGREPFFWPPAFPLVSGLLALGLDPQVAAHTAATLVVGLLVLPLGALGRRLEIPHAGPVAAALVLATPSLRQLAALPSGRGLALLGLLGAAAVALSPMAGRRRALGVGALLALAVLSRREAALTAGVIGLAVLLRDRREGAIALGVVLAAVGPWLALLSLAAGSPRLSSRGWEAAVYAWDRLLPHEWVLMEFSMGAWGAPLRRGVSTAAAGASSADLAVETVPGWLRHALPAAVPLWLAALGALGGGMLASTRRGRHALAGLVVLGVPPLLLSAVPNARSVVYPANNLHPTTLAVLLPAMAAVGTIAQRLSRRLPRWAVAGWVAAGLTLLSLAQGHWMSRVGPTPDEDPEILPAAAAALAAGRGPVAATLAGSVAVLRAGRPRERVPGPWLVGPWLARHPDGLTVLLTQRDEPGARRSLDAIAARRSVTVAWTLQGRSGSATALTVGPASEPRAEEPPGP